MVLIMAGISAIGPKWLKCCQFASVINLKLLVNKRAHSSFKLGIRNKESVMFDDCLTYK